MDKTFLFDTYAIIEILKGSEDYKEYADAEVIVNQFITAELAYYLTRKNKSQEEKEILLEDLSLNLVHPENKTLMEAAKMRYDKKKQNMSLTDCIGYKLAEKLGIKFLTGDKEFKDMKNVEFVK